MPKMDLETRRRQCARVTLDDLIEGLRRVGVQPGDTVLCHSSLSKFGYVEGGAETVVEALLKVVGPEGTVASAAGQPSADLGPNPVFDILNTPARRGVISEAVRKRADGRSPHLVDSISALGPAAAYLTSTHSDTNCGADSPYQKIMATDAQILLLAVSHNSNTTFEAIEEEMAPPYVKFREVPGVRMIDEFGQERPLPTRLHDYDYPYDFNRMNDPLIRAGAQTEIVIGEAIVRRISAAKMRQVVMAAIQADPFALRLRPGQRRLPEIPTSIHDLPG